MTETAPPQWTKALARQTVKEWLIGTVKPKAASALWLADQTGLDMGQIFNWLSWSRLKTPPPSCLHKLATAVGETPPEVVLSATWFLFPREAPESGREDPMAAEIMNRPLASIDDVALWIAHVRKNRRAGKVTQIELSGLIGRSPQSISKWESTTSTFSPNHADLQRIAEVCGFPEPQIAFEMRPSRDGRPQIYMPPRADTLREEIQHTAIALASRCFKGQMAERNARMLMDRYCCSGTENSTLQAIGDKFGVTRERVRLVEERMMEFVSSTTLDTHAFDALAEAAGGLTTLLLSEAEDLLRPHLGEGLSLEGAIAYGADILGRRLPVSIIKRAGQEPLVTAGDLPDWYGSAATQCRALIRHCGATLPNLAWAMTLRATGQWVPYEDFLSVMERLPGYQRLDDTNEWFWLGPDGANRVVERAILVLQNAPGAVDIEIIYGGIVRQDGADRSSVFQQSALWPPMSVVGSVLAKHPSFVCKQFNDFSLAAGAASYSDEEAAADVIVSLLSERDGLASRWEINEWMAADGRFQHITVTKVLAISPRIAQVDRGVFAIRGWPLSAARLEAAQEMVGGPVGKRTIEIDEHGRVCWEHVLTRGAVNNHAASLPARAKAAVPEGRYQLSDGHYLTVVEDRIAGLVPHVVRAGAQPGWTYRVCIDVARQCAMVDTWATAEADEPALEA